jgi:hypothetical protein
MKPTGLDGLSDLRGFYSTVLFERAEIRDSLSLLGAGGEPWAPAGWGPSQASALFFVVLFKAISVTGCGGP